MSTMETTSSPSASSSSGSESVNLGYLGKYKILERVGEGGFGVVFKCLDTETKKIVAIKKKVWWDLGLGNEASILKLLMDNKLDQFNIVKYYGGFSMKRCLVFENLDISLGQYLIERKDLMHLQDIRTVIQQLAVAFDALKNIGVIHTDVNTNNIMLVDHVRQPFRVKLIDFGLAILRRRDKQNKIAHYNYHMAPEVMLGLPISEAIDMWALGTVMARMVVGVFLFPGNDEHEILRYIVDLLGPPPDHVINAGKKSSQYFKKTASQHWKLMKYRGWKRTDNRRYTFRSLDELITMRLEKNSNSEADEMRECINLMKAMFNWDAGERITPSEVLAHPFITRSYLNKSSSLNNCHKILASTSTESGPSKTDKPSMNQAAEPGTDEVAEPSMNQAAGPGTDEVADPSMNQAAEPGTDEVAEPSMNQAAGPGTDEVADPSMNQAAEPGTDEVAEPSMNQAAGPGTDEVADPSMNQAAEPGTDEVAEPSMNQAAEPGIWNSTTLPSGVIMVQSAPLADRIPMVETDADSAPAPATFLDETNNPDKTDDSKPKKKKRNCFKHFFSWCKRTFCPCCCVSDAEE